MKLLNLKRAAAISATALGMLAVPAAAASAAPASDTGTLPAAGACVAYATHDAPPLQCFATFTEALDKASGGRLTDGPKNADGAAADKTFNAKVDASNADADAARLSAAAGGTVLSIEYTGINYTGSPVIWTGNNGNCSTSINNTDYQVASMAWDNMISSYKTYANCWTKHWENTNYGGASVGYNGTRANIGAAMDNRSSSEQWS